jgi:hypothetical protein
VTIVIVVTAVASVPTVAGVPTVASVLATTIACARRKYHHPDGVPETGG